MTTAVTVAQAMNLPAYARVALEYENHPQDRTHAFHQMFGAPIRTERPDATFSHMDDQRVAFRASFIISEIFEILEKGLGLRVCLGVRGPDNPIWNKFVDSSDNAALCDAILAAMQDGGKRDLIEVVDGLGDLNVVVNGFAIELGVDMLAVDQEVYASNMTKLGEDGDPIVADGSDPKYPAGKILKGPNFLEPQLSELLRLAPAETEQVA